MIAGGQSLGPLLNLRLASPGVLVDVNRLPLADVHREDGTLILGALVRQRDAEHNAEVAAAAPLLAEALPWIGHVAIRNRGTVGGSLAHADPASELPAVAVALRSEVVAASVRGRRVVPAAGLFAGPLQTVLEPDELLVSLRVPAAPPRTGSAWIEIARRHGDFALAGVAVTLTLGAGDAVVGAAIVLSGVGPTPVDADEAARSLLGGVPGPASFEQAAAFAAGACRPASDVHASAGYRRRVATVLVRRALERAYDRARGR